MLLMLISWHARAGVLFVECAISVSIGITIMMSRRDSILLMTSSSVHYFSLPVLPSLGSLASFKAGWMTKMTTNQSCGAICNSPIRDLVPANIGLTRASTVSFSQGEYATVSKC